MKKFADYLLSVMSTSSDESPQMSMMHDADHPVSIHDPLWSGARAHDLVRMTSAVLGRLVLHSGALTTEIVDAHVQRAIELLRAKGDNRKVTGMKRYAASLNLVQLARNAPTIFNVHVPIFVASIWKLRCEIRWKFAKPPSSLFTSVYWSPSVEKRDIACSGTTRCTRSVAQD